MKKRQIYRKILVFVLPRIPFYILGFFAAAIVFCAWPLMVSIYNSENEFLIVAGYLVTVFVWINVSGFNKLPYQCASISLINKALNGKEISKHPYKEGMKDVKDRFGVYSIFGMISSTIRFIFDKEKDEKDKNDIIADIKAFVTVNALNLIVYFRTCLLSQIMYYKDKTYTQCIFETLEIIKKNWLSFIFQTLKVFIIYVVLPVIINQILIAALLYLLIGVTHIEGTVMMIVELMEIDTDLLGVCAGLSVLAYVFLGYLFVSPNATIQIVKYFNELRNKTVFDYSLYERFDAKIVDNNKFLRRLKKADNRKQNKEIL